MTKLTKREKRLLALIEKNKIKPLDLTLYLMIMDGAGPGMQDLQERSNLSFNTVRKSLQALEEVDLIEIESMARKLGIWFHGKD